MSVWGRETIELLDRTALLTKAMAMPDDVTIVFLTVSDKISTEADANPSAGKGGGSYERERGNLAQEGNKYPTTASR